MPELFWCWVGGGWFGKVCHEAGGFGGSLMVWHSWATWFVMSSYVTWHGTHGIHVGGLSCHGMTWNTCRELVMLGHGMARMEYISGIAMSWHAWNTCRGLPCHGMHGIHVGGCHVTMHLRCHAMSSGSKAGPCSQTLQLNFGRISAPDLFTLAEEAVWASKSCRTVILLRPRHAIPLNRPNRLAWHLVLMCWF